MQEREVFDVLVRGELVYVFADPATMTARPVPQDLRDVMLANPGVRYPVLVPNEKLSALGVIRALAKGRVPSLLFHNRLTPEQSRQLAQDPGLQRHCLGSTCIDQFEAGRITAQHLIDRGRLPAQAQWWLMSGDRATPACVRRRATSPRASSSSRACARAMISRTTRISSAS